MFDSLSDKLSGILDRLTRRGALTEADVDQALREVRRALIEADVALDVARAFVDQVRSRAVGVEVIKSVTPGQMVVKIVHDQLIATLGADSQQIDLHAPAPVAIMMVGLQGSGNTTTAAKLAKRLAETARRKVLMASLDTRRPAAMEQLAVLGRQVSVDTLPIVEGQAPVQIARRALDAGRLGGYDVVILDTAGRVTLDEAMMAEAAEVKRAASPHEVLLVADALTGQDAVNLARAFNERVGLTGIVLTRVDGDGRGGAALSMRAVTGKPIKLIGTGEKLDALEDFHPARIADRILGMGDIVSLVEKAAATIDAEQAARVAERMRKGAFDLADLREQLTQMTQMGGLGGLMGMLPGIGKIKNQLAAANLDDRVLKRQVAIIDSMTPRERRNPDVLKASRVAPLPRRHGIDDGDLPLEHAVVEIGGGELVLDLADARQHAHEPAEAAHLRHLRELLAQVGKVERALAHPLGDARGLLGIDGGRGLLHQRDDVAHPQDAVGDARGVEVFQRIELLAGADELDRLSRYRAHGERSAAAAVAVDAGEHDAGEPHALVEGAREVDGVLAGQRIGDEERLVRVGGALDLSGLRHHRLVERDAAGGVEDDHVVAAEAAGLQRAPRDLHRRLAFDDRQRIDRDYITVVKIGHETLSADRRNQQSH